MKPSWFVCTWSSSQGSMINRGYKQWSLLSNTIHIELNHYIIENQFRVNNYLAERIFVYIISLWTILVSHTFESSFTVFNINMSSLWINVDEKERERERETLVRRANVNEESIGGSAIRMNNIHFIVSIYICFYSPSSFPWVNNV